MLRRGHLAAGLLTLGLTLGPGQAVREARAGALGDVVGGILKATGGGKDGGKGGGGGGGGGGGSVLSAVVEGVAHGLVDASFGVHDPTATSIELGTYYAPPAGTHDTDVYFYAGAQSVRDSDGAYSMELRVMYDDFGIGVRNTSFFEKEMDEYVHLDLRAVTGYYRAYRGGRTAVFMGAGLGNFATVGGIGRTGLQVGLRAVHGLGGALAVDAEGNSFWFRDDIRANEARVGFQASVLRISYRIVDFNVGPPLRGPEVGLVFNF